MIAVAALRPGNFGRQRRGNATGSGCRHAPLQLFPGPDPGAVPLRLRRPPDEAVAAPHRGGRVDGCEIVLPRARRCSLHHHDAMRRPRPACEPGRPGQGAVRDQRRGAIADSLVLGRDRQTSIRMTEAVDRPIDELSPVTSSRPGRRETRRVARTSRPSHSFPRKPWQRRELASRNRDRARPAASCLLFLPGSAW
jgi:hypothetical protein